MHRLRLQRLHVGVAAAEDAAPAGRERPARLFYGPARAPPVNGRTAAIAAAVAAAAAAAAIAAAAIAAAPPPGGPGPAEPPGPGAGGGGPGAAPAAPDPKLGIIVNTPGAAVTLAELDSAYARAASAGAGRGNVYMFWDRLEPERDAYNWAEYDTFMALHEKNGMNVTLYFSLVNGKTLGPFPPWIGNPSLLSVPTGHLVDAVDAVLDRYHIVDSVVIAGDADEHFRHRERDIPLYEAVYSEFYNATKEAHPGVAVGNAFSLNNALDKDLLDTVRRLSVGDFAAFTYRPTDPLNEINRTPEQARADLDRMREIVPDGTPVALLEVGWATSEAVAGSEADQAAFAAELYGYYADNADAVQFVTWYRLYDRPAGACAIDEDDLDESMASGLADSRFVVERLAEYVCSAGLLEADGGEKAAWKRVSALVRSGGADAGGADAAGGAAL